LGSTEFVKGKREKKTHEIKGPEVGGVATFKEQKRDNNRRND